MVQCVSNLRNLMLGMAMVVGLMAVPVTQALDVGQPAPDFTLPSTTGETIRLSQFKGKKHVFIQFYTTDFNPT